MTVYCVFKHGIYRHECGGVFQSLEFAVQAAKLLAQGEPDDWHWYEVIPFEMNRQTEQDDRNPNSNMKEPEAVYWCHKHKNGTIKEGKG